MIALFTIAAVSSLNSFGLDSNRLPDPSYPSSYRGSYYLAPNNTWVYNVTYVWDTYRSGDGGARFNSTSGEYYYPPVNLSDVVRDCSPGFATCKLQDDFINTLWHGKPQRLALDVTVAVAEILALLMHFTLFVWACVDTHRRNSSKKGDQAQVIAQAIIQDMQERGLVTIHGSGPMHQQRYPMQPAPMPPAPIAPFTIVKAERWA